MKVLLIDVNYKQSSSGKIVYSLANYLKTNDNEVVVAYGRGEKTTDKNVFKIAPDFEVVAHVLLSRLTGVNGCYSPIATYRLIEIIKHFKPDVIHIHELHGYYVNVGSILRYISKKNIPVVWTFHCEYMYTGRCGIANECEDYKKGCGNCKFKNKYPKTMIFDFSKQMLKKKKKYLNQIKDLVICAPSNWLDNRIAETFLFNRRHEVVYNGVDTSIFYPRSNRNIMRDKYGIGQKKVVISVASDLLKRTGDNIFKLANEMQENIFVMIGVKNFPENVPCNVLMFEPTCDQNWLAEMYSMADVCMICSEKETFSLPCAEALCCGIPVVGFKAGGPETTFEAPYALFCEYGDIEHLKQLVIRQINSGVTSKQCANYGKALFSESTMICKYFEYYKSLLEEEDRN